MDNDDFYYNEDIGYVVVNVNYFEDSNDYKCEDNADKVFVEMCRYTEQYWSYFMGTGYLDIKYTTLLPSLTFASKRTSLSQRFENCMQSRFFYIFIFVPKTGLWQLNSHSETL